MSQTSLAVHTAAWVREWGEDLVPHLTLAAQLGFDGAEVSLLGMDDAQAARLAQAASDLGIALKCTTGLSRLHDVTSADPAIRQAGIAYLRRAADLVALCAADLLSGVIYAPWGVASSADRGTRTARAAEALAEVAHDFGERGITLAVEALNRFETDLVTTAAEAANIVGLIGQPNVGILLDTFHMNIEERSIRSALVAAGPHLVHVQLADNDRGAPGTGHIDWDEVFEALAVARYQGWLSLELFLQAGVPVSEDLRIWRNIHPDPTTAARDGLRFVREKLANARAAILFTVKHPFPINRASRVSDGGRQWRKRESGSDHRTIRRITSHASGLKTWTACGMQA